MASRRLLIAAVFLAYFGVYSRQALAQFETRSASYISSGPFSAAVGDFDGDGKLDLAVSAFNPSNDITILLGNGDGTFRRGATYSFGAQFSYAIAADFRYNGTLDLVVGDTLSGNIYVLRGNGDGTFSQATAYPTAGPVYMVATGDFTGDGKLDIIGLTESAQCECISVLPGHGDGTFGAPVTTPIPYGIAGFGLAVGHFSADNNLDVAVAGYFGSANQVDILLGNGDGTFRASGYYPVSPSPLSVAAADFNGDGRLDLAVGSLFGGISVLLANGDGTFQDAVNYAASAPTRVVAADLDGDGKIDLAASALESPSGVTVLKGNGDGTFQPGVLYPTIGGTNFVALGDFNGDSRPDMVVAATFGYTVITLLNTGTVSFSPTTPLFFKKQMHGTTSKPQTVKLTNAGTGELKISTMRAAGQFGMTSTCRSSVAAGASCTISVSFSPTYTGAKSGTVTINDSESSRPMVIELSGTGT
ncbi:MAG: FG-GAP-like repeat-containing protein [Candidatus Sulfotelmatobacter sp.]